MNTKGGEPAWFTILFYCAEFALRGEKPETSPRNADSARFAIELRTHAIDFRLLAVF